VNEKIRELLIATGNEGKVREFAEMMAGRDVRLLSLSDMPPSPEIEESGATFVENAILKARGQALAHGMWTLADDSGLEVFGLGGRPGVLSARYGGMGLSDSDRTKLLLDEMKELSELERGARFVCALAIASPDGRTLLVEEGECRGTIAPSPLGMGGFGYDPIFVPNGFTKTFAELGTEQKEAIGHRGKASRKILSNLDRMGLL
jgi:XTP/dITP diphosphohydrolase